MHACLHPVGWQGLYHVDGHDIALQIRPQSDATLKTAGNYFPACGIVRRAERPVDAAGGVAASPSVGGVFSVAMGWELDHRFELQGAGTWLSRSGTSEFAADTKLLFNMLRPAKMVPYVAAGVGVYDGVLERTAAETNPTAVLGGGAHIYLRPHLSFRPEATVRLVVDGSDVHPATVVPAIRCGTAWP